MFNGDAPWTARAAVVIFVLIWFWELNTFLSIAWITVSKIHLTDRQRVGAVGMLIGLSGWQILNATVIVGLVYRRNWARIIELALTVFGLVLVAALVAMKQPFAPGVIYFSNAAATLLLFSRSARAWFIKPIVKLS
ncbi:hypothetical protein [Paraburkholderia sp. DHOC27]|uniref:hypothetical protein n=1 Tax=Paraburkholderia sp. DHOC27 TaxID=2303330 RepID=UPI000E3CB50E|nr:hypothetical protein [Paraburkholderia sp. DHOC27]RFU49585.1 hypothetical protein D0B32_07315 [Paraburkholderia sp. DHOC27]